MSPIITVVAAARPGSKLEELARVSTEALHGNGFRLRAVPLHQLPESALLAGDADAPTLRWTRRLLTGSAGVVLITPCYEAPMSRLVRTWLELMPPLRGTVQVVGLGATQAQASGVDYAARRLLREHGAQRIAPACFVRDRSLESTVDGWSLGGAAQEHLAAALGVFREELASAA